MFPRRTATAMTVLFLFTLPFIVEAKPKSRVFDASPERVFAAAHKVAREKHRITYVDEKNLLIGFETGLSLTSYGRLCNASVQPAEGGKAKLTINTQRKALSLEVGDRTEEDFFDRVAEELRKGLLGKDELAKEERKRPGADAKTGHISLLSEPDAAEIWIDGKFIGNAPSKIELPIGKHSVRMLLQGFEDWEREIEVLSGSQVTLKASLAKRSS